MNNIERVEYHRETEKYFETNQVRDLFAQFNNALLIDLPDEPLEYLIKMLKDRRGKQIICVIGNDLEASAKAAELTVSANAQHNYREIKTHENHTERLLGKVDHDYDAIYNEIKNADDEIEGFVLKNFPININQALWMARKRLIPNRIFVLEYPKGYLAEQCRDQQLDENYLDMYNLLDANIGAVKEFYKDAVYEIPLLDFPDPMDYYKIIRNVTAIRHRTITPKRPPRILFLGYPTLNKTFSASEIAKGLGMIHVSVSNLLEDERKKKSSIGEYTQSILLQKYNLPDDVVCTMVQDRLNQTDCTVQGYILEGFPSNLKQWRRFSQWQQFPSISICYKSPEGDIDADIDNCKMDVTNGDLYNGEEYSNCSEDLKATLRPLEDGVKTRLKERVKDVEKVFNELNKLFASRCLTLYSDMRIEDINNQLTTTLQNSYYYS